MGKRRKRDSNSDDLMEWKPPISSDSNSNMINQTISTAPIDEYRIEKEVEADIVTDDDDDIDDVDEI